jgi:hypothetical protein
MQVYTVLSNRAVHLLALAVALVVAFVLSLPLSQLAQTALVVLPVAAWYLGVLYERSIVLTNGLADEDELRAAERDAASLFR